MSTYRFYDCNASFGRRSVVNPGSFALREELLERMAEYTIDRALVYHAMAKEYDPQVGNAILLKEIEGTPALSPLWAVLPHYTGEFDPPVELLAKMRANGVKAVTMFPAASAQFFSFAEFTCGELFNAFEEHAVPLFIGLDQLNGMQAVDTLCSAHPALRVVLTNVNYRIDRDLYPLLGKHPHLHVETSGYKTMEGIAEICKRFGAERLLFGSGMPVASGSAAVGLITYSGVSDEEKRMIASGNLENLLGGVRL